MRTRTKQKYLNNFVQKVNGLGAARDTNGACRYYMSKKHPGCAIGCQPQFDSFRGKAGYEFGSISTLCDCPKLRAALFGRDKDTDGQTFLQYLQAFHDDKNNWDEKKLKLTSVKLFCERFGLIVPRSDKYSEK